MAKVILFGGGDGGGIIIGPDGVRPIPPWDPALRRQLRSISALLQAAQGLPDAEVRGELGELVNRLTNLSVTQVEAVAPDRSTRTPASSTRTTMGDSRAARPGSPPSHSRGHRRGCRASRI
jgi:hypothetical protein